MRDQHFLCLFFLKTNTHRWYTALKWAYSKIHGNPDITFLNTNMYFLMKKTHIYPSYLIVACDGQKRQSVNETRTDRLGLKRDFQNCLWNFSGSNIKKVTDLTSLTVWDRRNRRLTAKNGKIVNETRPDRLRLKCDFQNCL